MDEQRLLPFLALESKSDRSRVNHELAAAYYSRHKRRPDAQALRRARSCVDRAWLLSRYSPQVLPLLTQIYRAQQDALGFQRALKEAGVERASRGDFDGGLELFDRWIYAHAAIIKIDTQSYDADIIASVERMSLLHRFEPRVRRERGGKTRVAYLMQGLTQVNSVLVRIDQTFARLHDKSRFEVAYFAVENEEDVAASPDAQSAIRNIGGCGWEVNIPAKGGSLFEQLLSVGKSIYDFEPDVLVTCAALATFKNYLVASLKPAPVIVALHQGATPLFTWHSFDHSISWFLTNLLDCPADCSHVPLEFELPERDEVPTVSRAELDMPDGARVALSGGRWQKFQGPALWRAMADALLEHPDLYWLVVGVDEAKLPFLKDVLPPELRSRIRFRPWGRDYLRYLAVAELVVDTYPVGGGLFLMEAMGLALPVISFENDYVNAYDDNDSSGGTELVGIPELMVGRGDMGELKERISELLGDEGRRRRLGEKCYRRVRETRNDPARMVRRCEEILESVLEGHREVSRGGDDDSRAAHSALTQPRLEPRGGDLEGYRRILVEQSHVLDRREAELRRREARFLLRLERALRWRWRRLTGKSFLGYPN